MTPESQTAAQKLRFNEASKLTASWLSGLATAAIGAGTFAPMFALIYGISGPHIATGSLILISAVCLCGGVSLHLVGRLILHRLEP